MKKHLLLLLFLAIIQISKSQEKGSILLGVTTGNNQPVNLEIIKQHLLNTYTVSIKKIESCVNHSLIHIVVNINYKPIPTSQDIMNNLIAAFPGYQFFEKYLHESLTEINCKWK
jgi:hypothetical protein